jgi:hypothetical protein
MAAVERRRHADGAIAIIGADGYTDIRGVRES